MNYQKVTMLMEPTAWQEKTAELSKRLCAKKKKSLELITLKV
jgi:hypothetical protein